MQKPLPVLITGCSSGIGLCVAHGLKNEGFQVIASARKSADVEHLRDEGMEAVQLDLDDRDSLNSGLREALRLTGGRLYGLFNNGAYGQPGAVEDLTWETLEAQLRTNLLSWHELTRQVIPIMRAQGSGRIIQNSSVLGFAAMPYRGAYNCSKFALEGLSDTLRLELAGTGIFVSLVEPGPISSKFRENAYRKYLQNIDKQRSPHRANYEAMEARLKTEGDATRFTLPPEAVLKKVLHALRSPRPKARYPVTIPTYAFAFLRRVLSTRQMDALLRLASGSGAR
jgi:short-subunit dehydrogenase